MFSICQGSDDYQRLRPEAGARFVLVFSMPIAWPAVADGVAQGTAPNRAFSVRPAATGATWLLMLVAVIVGNLGIGFFAYGTVIGHRYAFCKGRVASILEILRGRAGLRIRAGWLNRLIPPNKECGRPVWRRVPCVGAAAQLAPEQSAFAAAPAAGKMLGQGRCSALFRNRLTSPPPAFIVAVVQQRTTP